MILKYIFDPVITFMDSKSGIKIEKAQTFKPFIDQKCEIDSILKYYFFQYTFV